MSRGGVAAHCNLCACVILTSMHVDIFISLHTQQGIVRLLRQSDAQLFAGWDGHPSINDVTTLEKIDCLANKAATLLQVSRTFPRRN